MKPFFLNGHSEGTFCDILLTLRLWPSLIFTSPHKYLSGYTYPELFVLTIISGGPGRYRSRPTVPYHV